MIRSKGSVGVIDLEGVFTALTEMIGDRDVGIRIVAIDVLGTAARSVSVEPPAALAGALDDESTAVRAQAIKALRNGTEITSRFFFQDPAVSHSRDNKKSGSYFRPIPNLLPARPRSVAPKHLPGPGARPRAARLDDVVRRIAKPSTTPAGVLRDGSASVDRRIQQPPSGGPTLCRVSPWYARA
jgi:hypothetical protein